MSHNNQTSRLRGLLLLPAGLLAVAAAAYNISGIVTDTEGLPMPDATVRVLAKKDSSFVRGGVADLDGRFSIIAVR